MHLAITQRDRRVEETSFTVNVVFISFQVIEKYNDFAFSDYARVGRSLVLYEVGNREDAIAEMEDVSISLKGYPGTHLSRYYVPCLS